jgi:hypothetical protein
VIIAHRIAVAGKGKEAGETKERAESINEIYEKQQRDGFEISALNTYQVLMGLCMDIFLDQMIQEYALAQMTPAEKKEKRRQTGQMENDRGARISAVIVASTAGYGRIWKRKGKRRQNKEQAG